MHYLQPRLFVLVLVTRNRNRLLPEKTDYDYELRARARSMCSRVRTSGLSHPSRRWPRPSTARPGILAPGHPLRLGTERIEQRLNPPLIHDQQVGRDPQEGQHGLGDRGNLAQDEPTAEQLQPL